MNETSNTDDQPRPQPKPNRVGRAQPARSGPPGSKNAVKHGMYVYKPCSMATV